MQPSLPFERVHLILGNDLAGDKVVVNGVVTEKPYLEQSPESCWLKEVSQNPVYHFTKNGVSVRNWRPLNVPVEDDWTVKHQIVVPKSCRQEILSMAHETPLAGHMGVTKTCHKICNHFYLLSLRKDEWNFGDLVMPVRWLGNPNHTIPKARLQPILAVQEPFRTILVDYQRVNAWIWRSSFWSLSTRFLMFPHGQIIFITILMLAMLIL